MTLVTIGYIGIAILILLLFSGIHIGIVMMLIGFFGMSIVSSWTAGLNLFKTVPFSTFANYGLSVAPLFILMGSLCYFADLSKDLYDSVHKWLGHFKGGLAMATVGACAAFAAICGSSLATAAAMGTVALPEMKRYKYDDALATGCVAAGGTIGIMIPPSITMIIYCVLTQQSIGKLFIAGVIPGILQAIFYMITIYILCQRNPLMGPPGPKTTFPEKIVALKGTWAVLLLFLVVIGGIYLGVFSPTEAAGVGACGAFFLALARRRLNWHNFKDSLVSTVKDTAMIFLILTGAMFLGYFLAATRLPFEISTFVSGLQLNRYVILVIIILLYIFLGCIMDSLAMILLTVPIFFPLITALQFDPIWFGIMVVRVVEIGLITPPVGINVFVIQGVAKDVPMYTIFRGIVPFLIADMFHIILLIVFPEVATFLPSMMH